MHRFIFKIEQVLGFRFPIPEKWRWQLSISSEVAFWDNYYRTKGGDWKNKYQLKFDPNLEVQPNISKYFPSSANLKILDVGAGPMTFLGKIFSGQKINITATDPLADQYDEVLGKYEIDPLVRTIKCHGEKLDGMFDESTFDVVLAKNSIDHSYDPVKVIVNMIKLTKDKVILIHAENEADNESWYGLHQWNFFVENGDFIISGRQTKVNFSAKYKNVVHIDSFIDEIDGLLYVVMTKKNSFK
ncbi:methyltransferase domain-containing protein [Ekhidna sp.]